MEHCDERRLSTNNSITKLPSFKVSHRHQTFQCNSSSTFSFWEIELLSVCYILSMFYAYILPISNSKYHIIHSNIQAISRLGFPYILLDYVRHPSHHILTICNKYLYVDKLSNLAIDR